MRRVVWSEDAEQDYLDILRYSAADNPEAAEQVGEAIAQTSDGLAHFATGHPGRVSGTYEKSLARLPYILAYALIDDRQTVIILRVIHGARDWGTDRWPD